MTPVSGTDKPVTAAGREDTGEVNLSCIIPAYNEAARVAAVVRVAAAHPLIDEVVVVDDGSVDGTAAAAAAIPGVRVLRLERNGGKTNALATGIEAARGHWLVLLDADLTGLTAAALTRLVRPVLTGRAEVTISLRGNAPLLWRMIGIDYLSGERVVARDFLAGDLDRLRQLPRFGFEVHMNRELVRAGQRPEVVRWPGVESPGKARKCGLLQGMIADLRMLGDIFQTISPGEAAAQILRLRLGPDAGLPLRAARRSG